MKNLLSTIPKNKFENWAHAERVCQMCDGTTERGPSRSPWFWLINTMNLPKHLREGAVCFMIFDGVVRGYFDIVDTDKTENWRDKHVIGKARETSSLILANWHPISEALHQRGFQGWRYTDLQP